MSYPISKISDIDAAIALKLKAQRIRTTAKLLEQARDVRGRQELAKKIGVDECTLLRWANAADRMRIKGIGDEYACLLAAVGVDTVRELKYRNPRNLAKAMAAANEKRKLVAFLPSEKAVKKWIDTAKTLPLKISY
jgi:uncharacterized protein DUF4332